MGLVLAQHMMLKDKREVSERLDKKKQLCNMFRVIVATDVIQPPRSDIDRGPVSKGKTYTRTHLSMVLYVSFVAACHHRATFILFVFSRSD